MIYKQEGSVRKFRLAAPLPDKDFIAKRES